MPLLYGLHDRQAAPHVPAGGWCVDTVALSENPQPTDYRALRADINWIVRLNWGYGSTGTIPLPSDYEKMAVAATAYVHNSRGASIWIIGNEPNHEQERPNGVFITPEQYARCFKLCRDMIKRSFPNAQVIPAPCAPYHANPIPWTDYLTEMLQRIAANGGCDGIAVHTYTRSSNPADIESGAQMGPPLQNTYSGFLSYLDALDCVPASMLRLPVYITEFNELLEGGWDDRNTGVVQAAYADIDSTNRSGSGNLPIQCLILYRWPKFDQWHIEGKQGVIDDFRAAVGRGYTSPVKGNDMTETLHIPLVSPGTVAAPDLPNRQISDDFKRRVSTIKDAAPNIGQKFFRLVKAEYVPDGARRFGPDHHILVDVVDTNYKRIKGAPVNFYWGSGMEIVPVNKTSEPYGADYGMTSHGNSYGVWVGNFHQNSDDAFGMGLGTIEQPDWNHHVTYYLVFQETIAQATPAIEAPTPAPVEPPKEPTMPSGIIEPRVAQAILKIESGGRTHGADGEPIIRFEAHIFKNYLKNDALWANHFRTDAQRGWVDQMWRHGEGDTWRPIHTGKQSDEYAAFEFAGGMNFEAAMKSISMGSAQIMGFNHARIGYPSATAMFLAFADAQLQTLGFINFCLSDPTLMDAIRRKDWRTIAARYNGTGAVDTYSKLLQDAYNALGG